MAAAVLFDILFPVFLGLGLWDENNSLLNVQYCDTPYTDRKSWLLDEFRTSFTNLSLNKEFTVRPLVKLFGGTIVAQPEETFKIPITPVTLKVSDVTETTAIAWGRIDGYELLDETMKFGLAYQEPGSTETHFYPASSIDAEGVFSVEFKDLKQNTEYRYYAYLEIEGLSDRFEGRKYLFTTDMHREPYYVWDNANKTATFYFDDQCGNRGGNWGGNLHLYYNEQISVLKIIFDFSFLRYYPQKFGFSGYYKLQSIDNLNYLNTDSITDMSYMFHGCYSLTSLDVSHFNTSNVTNMYYMFHDCSSLTSLDLSSFDTSNVTNITFMFQGCSSLTSLNLSSFNTNNITSMWSMFENCSSLTVLDLSSFKFNKSPEIPGMFKNCHSLKTIYAGDWNTTDTYSNPGPFNGCPNLTGGMGTKIGQNLYDYDNKGNPLYYNVEASRWIYARIDSGKDRPGLFTAK